MEFTRTPDDPDRITEQVELPEGQAILIADVPDWVNLPEELMIQHSIPTRRANVVEACYLDFRGETCLHYCTDVIINGRNLWVAKGADQFYWHLR